MMSRYCPQCTLNRLRKSATKQNTSAAKHCKMNSVKSPHKKTTPKLRAMNLADKWFSRFIRLKHSTEVHGVVFCKCYTCEKLYSIKNIDCGHYHNRGNKATRYDERNARPQCKNCNRFNSGRHTIFGDKLLKEYGAESFEELRQLALSQGEDSEMFYKEKAKEFRVKFNELVKEKGNPFG